MQKNHPTILTPLCQYWHDIRTFMTNIKWKNICIFSHLDLWWVCLPSSPQGALCCTSRSLIMEEVTGWMTQDRLCARAKVNFWLLYFQHCFHTSPSYNCISNIYAGNLNCSTWDNAGPNQRVRKCKFPGVVLTLAPPASLHLGELPSLGAVGSCCQCVCLHHLATTSEITFVKAVFMYMYFC